MRSTLILAAASGLAWAAYALFGRQLVLSALTSARWMPQLADPSRWSVRTALIRLLDPTFGRLLVFVWVIYLAAITLPRLNPRSRAGVLALNVGVSLLTTCLLWFAVESFLAPLLVRPLSLQRFYAVLDVDHRPAPSNHDLGTNSDGIRSEHESGGYPPGDFNILFLGDSYTYGYLVSREQAFPARVEAILRDGFPAAHVNVANFGWVSSSPLLSLRLLESIGRKYHPRLIVMCVDMTDFFDDLHYRNMLEQRGIYWYFDKVPMALRLMTVLNPGGYARWEARTNGVEPPRRFFMSEAPLSRTREYCEPLRRSLIALDSCAARLGARYMVVVLPRAYQYGAREAPGNWEKHEYTVLGPYALEPFRYFDELRPRVRFPVHSLLGDFQRTTVFPTCYPADPHWNPDGHEVAARAIAPLVAREIEAGTGLRPATIEPAGGRGTTGPAAPRSGTGPSAAGPRTTGPR